MKISAGVKLFLNLAKTQALLNRRFDSGLGGIGFSEFVILLNLSKAENETMRRIDLAEKIGLTASGVTRMLAPMEKIGLIKSGTSEQDARVRCVKLASGGRLKLNEGLERAELLAQDIIPDDKKSQVGEFSEFLVELCSRVRL